MTDDSLISILTTYLRISQNIVMDLERALSSPRSGYSTC